MQDVLSKAVNREIAQGPKSYWIHWSPGLIRTVLYASCVPQEGQLIRQKIKVRMLRLFISFLRTWDRRVKYRALRYHYTLVNEPAKEWEGLQSSRNQECTNSSKIMGSLSILSWDLRLRLSRRILQRCKGKKIQQNVQLLCKFEEMLEESQSHRISQVGRDLHGSIQKQHKALPQLSTWPTAE